MDGVTAAIKDYAPAHLPMVKAICIGRRIIKTLNELIEWDEQQCNLSPGDQISALIMNVLPEFFEGTDVENLFGEGLNQQTSTIRHMHAPSTNSLRPERTRSLIDRAWDHDNWTQVGVISERREEEDAASYKVQSFEEAFHGHDLRCVVVHSSSLDGRTERRVDLIHELSASAEISFVNLEGC